MKRGCLVLLSGGLYICGGDEVVVWWVVSGVACGGESGLFCGVVSCMERRSTSGGACVGGFVVGRGGCCSGGVVVLLWWNSEVLVSDRFGVVKGGCFTVLSGEVV